MKKVIFFSTILLFAVNSLAARSLFLFEGANALENGAEISLVNTPYYDPAELFLTVLNATGNAVDVKVKRTDLHIVDGTYASFCWGTSCYPPSIYISPQAVQIPPGGSNNTFRGDYTHSGNPGTSRVLYSFFNIDNPADSTWIIVNYTIANVADHSFEITHNDVVVNNDQELFFLYEPSDDPTEIAAVVRNINAFPVSARVKKYDLSLIESTNSNICWGPVCYPSTVFNTPDSLLLNPGVSDSSFKGVYAHNGIHGTSKVRFTIYNIENPDDSLSFVVNFTIGFLGLEETGINSPVLSNAYPNPATSSVYFDYSLPSNTGNARIRINNLLGTIVREITLDKSEGKAQLDVNSLKNGIYFYSLMINNSATITRKFVVKH